MLFLALWHGLHSGYLVCFEMEFLIVIVERQVSLQDGGQRGPEQRASLSELVRSSQAASLIRDSPGTGRLASITVLQPVLLSGAADHPLALHGFH